MATKKPTTKTNVTLAEEVPQQTQNPIEAKLDRIIELLEGTLMIKEKGLDLTNNIWWNKFLDK
jgi:hypothetical protein